MGGIHPRFKAEVGRRLALAFKGVPTPTLAGCTLKGNTSITLRFEALAAGESLKLQWERSRYTYTPPSPSHADASGHVHVSTLASRFPCKPCAH